MMRLVESRLGRLAYLEVGTGPAVLLVHGLAGDHSAWRPQIDHLQKRYRVVAVDNPGSGGSSTIATPVTIADLADGMIDLIDALDLASVHVVGRSMGGAVAQEMALRAPKRVASLALAGSFAALDPLGVRLIENMRDLVDDGASWKQWTRQFSFTFVSPEYFVADAERLARLESILADEDRDRSSYIHLANACLTSDTRTRLAGLTVPTMVMGGRLDPICSPTTTDLLAACLPAPEVVYFERSSHFFLMEEAEAANRTLDAWLSRQTAGPK